MAYYPQARYSQTRRPRQGHSLLFAPMLAFLIVGGVAASYIGYVLWPRWPGTPVTLQSPALPIIVAGTMFNIEPAAIRRPVQRRPGTQERVDLVYLWPSLVPPDPVAKPDVNAPADPNERLFVTIANDKEELSPQERVKSIYPRYLAPTAQPGPEGLTLRAFRDATPYQGEDLIYDPSDPDGFLTRCARSGIGNSGMCLTSRRVGEADVTIRFPRDWLGDWRAVAQGIARLIARLHPAS